MDPAFVERHWADLPNLARLRDDGTYSHLATTDPPQSPVAWSTFITGLDPGDHGIFDFVHRDPVTLEPYLSTDKTVEPRFRLPLGPYELPLSRSRVVSLRKGRAFWEYLTDAGIPVTIVRIPANYPPSKAGHEIAGMGTPDLRGTQGTFTFFTDDPLQMSFDVSGGLIRRVFMNGGHAELTLQGPPNTLRREGGYTWVPMVADVDPERPYVRLQVGKKMTILREGEWSDWIGSRFSAGAACGVGPRDVPRVRKATASGVEVVCVAGQCRSGFARAADINSRVVCARCESGHRGVYDAGNWRRYLGAATGRFRFARISGAKPVRARMRSDGCSMIRCGDSRAGFCSFISRRSIRIRMCFGASTNAELLSVYRAVDESIGEVMRREPGAELIVMSDHGFAAFDRAFNLNTFLASRGFRAKAYAIGLNGLYLRDKRVGAEIRRELLDFRDYGRQVIESVTQTKPSAENQSIAPDFIVGYAPGYRASWETALGEAPGGLLEDNKDAWIADHCIDPRAVPAVLFTSVKRQASEPTVEGSSGFVACGVRRRAAFADDGSGGFLIIVVSCLMHVVPHATRSVEDAVDEAHWHSFIVAAQYSSGMTDRE